MSAMHFSAQLALLGVRFVALTTGRTIALSSERVEK